KLLAEGSNFSVPSFETPRGIPTLPLREEDLTFIDQVEHSPHLFQRMIRKKYDLRITVVGHKVFSLRIDSQTGSGDLDWRNDYTVNMEPFALPADIESKCINLTRRLGLNYGAIDLILTDEGDYRFLEINCAGQYLWIELRTELQISREIALLLTGKCEPLFTSGSH
ncbi:MAG: hypothetical protein ACRD3W_26740, partial [Terriglobales bacterium]